MPYTLSWEARGVYKHFTGHISFQEYARSQEQVLSDVRTDDLRYVINDLSEVAGYSLTSEQAEYLAAFNRGAAISNPRLQVAYVTTDIRIIAMIKMASMLSAYKLVAFPTLDAARAWCASL